MKKMKIFLALLLAVSVSGSALFSVPAYADDEDMEMTDDAPDTEDVEENKDLTDEDIFDDRDNIITDTIPSEEPIQTLMPDTAPTPDPYHAETDTEDINSLSKKHSKAYVLMTNLAIIEEDYNSETIVTRGEFASLLTRMMGVTSGATTLFKDVFTKTANSKAIGIITGYGLMKADADGYFRPKDPLTDRTAAEALLKLAGYSNIIETYGGEDEGYTRLAAENGLVSDRADGSITWGRLAEIVYKALYMDVVDIESVSDKYGMSYTKTSTKLLSMLYGLKEAKGYVSANQYAGIAGRSHTSRNYIILTQSNGDWKFGVGDTDIKEKLGYDVTVFYYEDGSDDVIAAYIEKGDNPELEIKEKDFYEVDRSISELTYYEGTRQKKVRLERDAVMIYNGAMCYDISTADFENADSIHLVDADNDGNYDICSITSYEVYLVDSFSPEYGVVADKREGISFTIDDTYYDVIFKKYGFEIGRDSITEWDTLRVATTKKSSSTDLMTVIVASDIVAGRVTSKNSSDHTVYIDGKEYYVKKSIDVDKIFGTVAAGIDEDGKIICYKSDVSTERQYGYIIRLYKEYGEKGEEKISINFMDQTGAVITLPVAESFTVNNVKKHWEGLYKLVAKNRAEYDPDEELEGGRANEQIFAYTLDESGEIKKLYFAVDESGAEVQSGAVEQPKENLLVLNKRFTSPRVWDEYGTVNGEYIYGNNTKLFKVVTDADGRIIEELSGMFTKGQLRFSSVSRVDSGSRPSEVYCYDAGVERECSALLVKLPYANLTSMSSYARQIFLVDKVVDTIDSDGDERKQVQGYFAGAAAKFYADERKNIDLSKWEKGDVYFIALSTEGKIIAAAKSFSMTDTSVYCPIRDYTGLKPAVAAAYQYNPTAKVTTFAEGVNTMYGTVSNVSSKAIRITPEEGTEDIILQYSGTCVYIYHTGPGKIEISSTEGITKGMGTGKAYVYARYGFARDILIIK